MVPNEIKEREMLQKLERDKKITKQNAMGV